MAGPAGTGVHTITGKFYKVDEPGKVVFSTCGFLQPDGSNGIENMTTVLFEDAGPGQTKLLIHIAVIKAAASLTEAIQGMDKGWGESVDKMVEHAETVMI